MPGNEFVNISENKVLANISEFIVTVNRRFSGLDFPMKSDGNLKFYLHLKF